MRARLATSLIGAALLSCAHSHGRPRSLSAEQLRAEVDRHVCATWSEEADQWSAEFLSETCRTGATTELGETIRPGVSRAAAIVPLAGAAYDRFYAAADRRSRDEQEIADKLARQAFWSDPILSHATMRGVCLALRGTRFSSDSCATLPAPRATEVSWQEFFQYLRAYVWPVPGPDGSGVQIFVCAGINGAGALPSKEFVQAGFLAAAGVADDPELGARLHDLVKKHAGASADLSAVQAEVDALLNTPSGRRSACSALERTAWFTGVSVRDCP